MEIRKVVVDGNDSTGTRRVYAVTPVNTDPAHASLSVGTAFGERVRPEDWREAYVRMPEGAALIGEMRRTPFAGSRLMLVGEVRP